MAAEYRAWLVLDVFDADLRDLVLRNLDHRDGVNWDDRPRVSLRREGDVAVLCLADEDELFGKLTRRGERVTAISSAPFADVEFFRGKNDLLPDISAHWPISASKDRGHCRN